jgi:hypothetical protein
MEANPMRYKRLIHNSAMQGKTVREQIESVGPVFVAGSARRLAQTFVTANILNAIRMAWNALFFPEEEDKLRRQGREGHVIAGVDPETGLGTSVRVEGSMTHALSSIGLDDLSGKVSDLVTGEDDIAGVVAQSGNDLLSHWIGSAMPFSKTLVEVLSGYTAWPDATNWRPVRDRTEHALKLVKADKLWNHIVGKPIRPGTEWWNPASYLYYTTDMEEATYYLARGQAMRYAEKKNGDSYKPGRPTKQQNYLYQYRKAQQWGQPDAAERWLGKYLDAGGTLEGMDRSLDRQHPLSVLPQKDWTDYLLTLNPSERKELDQAIAYFQKRLSSSSVDPQVIRKALDKRREKLLERAP